jgi:hypothetical protein
MSEQIGRAKFFQQVDHAALFYGSLTDRNYIICFVFAGLSLLACVDQAERRPRETSAAGSFSAVAEAASFASVGGAAGATVDPRPVSSVVQGRPVAGRAEDRTRCAAISQQAENQRKPADIIFAVDTSPSMRDEIGFVRERLNAFSQQIVASGIDARIILISKAQRVAGDDGICVAAPLGSGLCPEDSKAPGYLHVPVKVGSHDALETIIETYPMWRGQLRMNARKSIVVVTDDDASGRMDDSAAAFQQSVAALDVGQFDSWTFSGIYCFSDCPDSAGIGTVYRDLVMQTNGVGGDLCTQNFDPVFDALAESVIESSVLDCEWSIPAPPTGQTFDRQQVNVRYTTHGAAPVSLLRVSDALSCGTRTGWHYDNELDPKRIVACPATCDTLQMDEMPSVDVLFGCESMLSPF